MPGSLPTRRALYEAPRARVVEGRLPVCPVLPTQPRQSVGAALRFSGPLQRPHIGIVAALRHPRVSQLEPVTPRPETLRGGAFTAYRSETLR